jgi:hypothetical protein
MGVIESSLGGYIPICNDCGVRLCWDISVEEYQDMRQFWDLWRCETCDPDAVGSRKRHISKMRIHY